MSCFIVGQRAPVREQLCNYCATRISTVYPADWTPINTVNDGESYGSRVGRLARPVTTSQLIGSDLRAWQRLWTDDGQTRSYPPLVVQRNNVAAATLADGRPATAVGDDCNLKALCQADNVLGEILA